MGLVAAGCRAEEKGRSAFLSVSVLGRQQMRSDISVNAEAVPMT